MQINFVPMRADTGYNLGFRTMTFRSSLIKDKMPLRFYSGDSSKLVSVIKYSNDYIQVRHFSFTDSKFQEIWTNQYHDKIREHVEKLIPHSPLIFSLSDHRPIEFSDFCLALPPRTGDEIFFTPNDATETAFNIYWMETSSIEERAAIMSVSSWFNFGVAGPGYADQTDDAKACMIYLFESLHNRGFPKYLDPTKVKSIAAYADFTNTSDHFSDMALSNNGELFAKSRAKVFGVIDVIEKSPTVKTIARIITNGKMTLSELIYYQDADEIMEQLREDQSVYVSSDVPDLKIRDMILTKSGAYISRTSDEFGIEHYASELNIRNKSITITNSNQAVG